MHDRQYVVITVCLLVYGNVYSIGGYIYKDKMTYIGNKIFYFYRIISLLKELLWLQEKVMLLSKWILNVFELILVLLCMCVEEWIIDLFSSVFSIVVGD